ncbi:MAG: DUF2019 domain-containing protein [Polyangiaceae bacterium]|nr:DUF2019 domain-containing protein [Polyangiaceae bacterium]
MKRKSVNAAEDMNEMLNAYREAAIKHRVASYEGNHRIANQAYARIHAIFRQIRDRDADDQRRFMQLLEDDDMRVRGWVAAHALELDPERAIRILESIAIGPSSLEEFAAKMVLREWRAGRLRFS